MKINIPISLTIFRVILIPVFVIAFYIPGDWSHFFTALVFLIAAVTDWWDGFLARKWNQTTRFGSFLDPVADKIMVTVALILIVQYYKHWYITLAAIIMISREIIISALREWMAQIGKESNVAVSELGKIKTLSQMTALTWLLWQPCDLVINAGYVVLSIAVILTLWSMFNYVFLSRKDLFQ